MIPKRFPSLGLRDPGFLQSAGWEPDIADADIFAYWSSDWYIVESGAGTKLITTWGDRCTRTVDKTDQTNTRNLSNYSSYPFLTSTDTIENIMASSGNILVSPWASSSCTRNTATTATFTAANGVLYQGVFMLKNGATYQLRVKVRNISGNTNLVLLHQGAPGGDTTAIVIDGTLTQYTANFTGPANAATIIYCGIKDLNAAGHGQIEVQEWHLIEVGNSTTYVATIQDYGRFAALGGNVATLSQRANLFRNQWSVDDALAAPFMWYMSVYFYAYRLNGWVFSGINPTWNSGIVIDAGNVWSSYCNASASRISLAAGKVPIGSWSIITLKYNGGANQSGIRYNKEAMVMGSHHATGVNNRGWYVGGDVFGGGVGAFGFKDIIIRSVNDDTATQDLYIDYLASRVGLAV